MYYTYVLANPKWELYIGYCADIKKRKAEHDQGKVYTTHRLGGPWKWIYYEVCWNEFDAKKRERYLKSGRGRQFLKDRLRNYFKTRG